ncbi:TRAP transporter permease [Desulfoscipio geothermicus]|uniref:TRAP transporter, 4TM/12TM fusion protein n=1 Tax=Desulfoscipio geothermicus DSM 3669 TaxID=1121426 RepID=A0A1I6DK10_9FIRM|nr:TRAP transporter permease [Desulfoscipio geothermicus]SFR05682.1 TRAP transporter, 4TM/12TM fusion protein [Desulfoscipio geothermicus DSM 3669]
MPNSQTQSDAKQYNLGPREEELNLAQAVMEKYDAASAYRKNVPLFWKWFIFVVSITLTLFQLYTAIFGTLISNQQRGFHVALALGLAFLLYPANKRDDGKISWGSRVITLLLLLVVAVIYQKGEISLPVALVSGLVLLLFHLAKRYNQKYAGIPLFDIVLSILGFTVGLYQFFCYEGIIARVGMYNDVDYVVAGAGVLLVLEAARRVIGVPIVAVGVSMLFYAYLGPYLPGFLNHAGFSVERVISHSFLSMEGVFGIPISISTTFIYLYMLFGVILQRTGLEKFFSDLAMSMTGWMTGGTAKVGVLTSVFSGMITGSSVANTVGNGAFTIPMMKRAGYKPEYAAAVEAASSTGGQIMPPIMGSAAFLMIEFTGLAYQDIMKAAIIPALLFFTGQFIAVHYESKKLNIMGVPRDRLPSVWSLLLKKGYMLLPIIAIVVILCTGQSAMKAALYGIYTSLGMSVLALIIAKILGKQDMIEDKLTLPVFFQILADAARTALPVIAACAAAGVIAGVITLTGLGLKISGGILSLAHNKLILTMFFTMIASIILGMGLPTTANYVITATMAAPALLAFDSVPVIAAHMFVFYFGIVADITPPVALAAYAGAGLANSNPFQTGVQAVKIAIGAFLIPYMFVLSPVLLMENATLFKLVIVIVAAMLGMFCISVSLAGFMEKKLSIIERVLLIPAGLALVNPWLLSDLFGLVILAAVFLYQKRSVRKQAKTTGISV